MGRQDILEEHLGLKVVHHPPGLVEPTIDVVAIHGKGAHPAHTWGALLASDRNPRDPSSHVNWLDNEDMLPAILPTARVLRFGYLSEWFGENALKTRAASIGEKLLDELKSLRLDAIDRPLIFIGHSFGGLVILKCMLQAKQEEWRWPYIFDSTIGLVFLGTPFRGTHDMLHTEILHNVEILFQDSQVMYENHRASNADNDWLRDLLDDFFRLLRQSQVPKIACFYEEKPTDLGIFLKGKAGYVHDPGKYEVMHVDETSACLDRTSQSIEKYARACNHLSMNKFNSATHPEWLTMGRVLLDMEQQDTGQSNTVFPALSLASQAPFDARNKQDDVDCLPGTRTEVLQEIKEWVANSGSPPVFWLNGSAGAGKSTIARTISRYLHSKHSLGASFFFSRDGGEALSGARLFYTTIACQLARAGPSDLRRHIHKAAQDNRDILDKGRTFQWTNLILNPLKLARSSGKFTRAIVIDALDECDNENDVRGFILLLAGLTEVNNFQIRVLVVSRPDAPIRAAFAEVNQRTVRSLSLDEQNQQTINGDIRLYLADRLQTIKRQQSINVHTWPEVRSVSRLVRLSAGLFIYAATACDFIENDIDRNAQASLSWFLEEMERTERQSAPIAESNDDMEHTAHLDRMYTVILQNALRDGKDDKKKARLSAYLKDLLGALVALQEPLAAGALQRLREVKDEDVRWRLNRLHSVIRVPNTDDSPLRLSHIAFRDFLLDGRRCTDTRFVLDSQLDHRHLFQNCMDVLGTCLRRDICQVDHPATSARKLEMAYLDKALPKWLKYTCVHWISHLILGSHLDMLEPAHIFLKKHLLHWLEAMGWVGKSQESTHMLAKLYTEFGDCMVPGIRELVAFFKDAHRFALFSQAILEAAPLQVYCSALLFAPRSSLVRRHFESEISSWADECGNRDADWDDCLQILHTPFTNFMAGVMAFSRDTKLVASGSPDGLIEIWNSGNNDTHEVARLSDRVADLAFSSDGKMLAACDDYKVCGIWSVSSGHPMRTSAHDRGHLALAFSQDGLTVLLATFNRDSRKEGGIVDLEFVFWDVMTGAQSVFEGLEIYVPSGKVAISPDMTAATYPREDYVALVKVPGTGQSSSKRLLSGHESAIGGATFSPDSKTVVTACLRSIRTWDVATGECKLVVPTDFRGPDVPPPAPIMSPDGYTIAARFRRATVSENYIGLWSTENGTKRKEFAMKFTTHDFASAFAPDGESFALLSDGEDRHVVLTTWDTLGAPNSEQSHKLKTKPPEDLVVSEAKQWVALAFRDRSFELWSVASDNAIAARILLWQESIDSGFTPARNLCFSSNGKRLAYQQHMTPVGSDKTDCVRVRDTETGEILPPTAWDDSDMAGVRIGFWDDGYRRVIPEPQMAALPVDIPVAGSWLCVNSDPVLLLPSQCRLHEAYRKTGLLAVDGNTIALAFASGKFSVLRVHPSKMQRFLGQHSYIPHLVQQRNYIGSVTLHWDTTGTQGVYTSVV